jgi:hypothetical protein
MTMTMTNVEGQGICLEITAKWIQEVAEAGGLDIDNLEKKWFRRVWR